MNKIASILIVFVFFSSAAMAQSDFRPGFIVTNAGDTIHGKIDYRGDQVMGSMCRFKENEEGPTEKYLPRDISAFRFTDNKYFVSREIMLDNSMEEVFLECLVRGEMSVFYYRSVKGDFYFIEKKGGDLVLLPYSEEMNYSNGKQYLWKSKIHIGILKSMTQDAPLVNSRLDHFGKPNRKNLISLAEDYHQEVNKQEKAVVYKKEMPFMKLALEPLIGFVKYKGVDGFVTEPGLHLFIWLPRSNERLFVKTGFLMSVFSGDEYNFTIVKTPLQLQYLFPKKAFRPKVSVGGNFYTRFLSSENVDHFHTIHLGTGFNYKVYNNLFLSTNVSAELNALSTAVSTETSAFSVFATTLSVGAYISF